MINWLGRIWPGEHTVDRWQTLIGFSETGA